MSFHVSLQLLFKSLLCLLSLVLVKIQPSLANPGLSCEIPFLCGNFTAVYPFWGGDRSEFCGHPSLHLNCQKDDTATVMISNVTYRVLNVNPKEKLLKIASQEYFQGLCPQKNNTIDPSLDSLLDIANGFQTLELIYGCPKFPGKFTTCNMNKDIINYMDGFIQFTGGISVVPDCNTSVLVQVSKSFISAAKRKKEDLEYALKSGFEIKWKVLGCDESCISCGYDAMSNKEICYCKDGILGNSSGCSESDPPAKATTDEQQHQKCSTPFRCGNIDNIGYPFWGENRSESCGYPGFELNCEGDVPEITILDSTYKVLKIDNKSGAFTVAREDYWDETCPSNLVNTTLNFNIFNYAPGTRNLTLYYNCPASFMNNILGTFQFHCNSYDETDINYFYSWDVNIFNSSFTEAVKAYFRSCENSVMIPLRQATLESMVKNPGSVNLTRALQEGFGLQWIANNSLCDECEGSNGQCGYSFRTGQFNCYCPDKAYPDSCRSSKGNKKISTVAGTAAGVVGITVILAILLIIGLRRHWKKKTENDQNVFGPGIFQKKDTKDDQTAEEAFIKNYESLAPRRYCYSDVNRMTKSFSYKLGQGGYGDVYKGQLPDGRLVAVKVLKNSKGNGEEFINEVASISRTSHVNIVSFLGFCYEKQKRALIYEFLPNGSLDRFIYDEESSNTNRKLEWRTMYQIAVGIAKGLAYLHRGCSIRIVHFDIKPHNILLDDEFCPKISDFGLAKLSEKKESIISMSDARGTIGYIAPEVFCRTFGGVSHKSDVYSYGMMILELVVGRKNADANANVSRSSEIYFPNAIYKNIEPGNDFKLDGAVTEEEKEMAKTMILVSLWCIQTNPYDRPSMHKVLEMLEGGIDNLQIPPKPSLSSPRRSAKQSSTASLSTESPS